MRPVGNVRIGGMLMLAVLAGGGCGGAPKGQLPVYPASGKVTLDGKELEGAEITLIPQEAKTVDGRAQRASGAVSNAAGLFEVATYRASDGAPAGIYRVTVSCDDTTQPRVDGDYPQLLPVRYQNPQESGLQVTIEKKSKNTLPPIELTSNP